MKKLIDLHIHTNLSDGILSPIQVIDEAIKNGVSIIGISDHDTIDAYTDDLYNYAKANNIKVINSVEISTKTDKCGIHILGYNFDINNKELKQKLDILKNVRHKYLYDVANKLNALGYVLNLDKLSQIKIVTKAHIALDIINNPQNKEILLKEFNCIPTKGDFIEKIMNEGCKAYVKKETITPKEASTLIKNANGKVILAHPVAYKYEDNLNDEEILKIIKEIDADGIESNYILIKNNNKIDESDKWNKFALDNNLITTIGSDFHIKDNIHPNIGLINENLNLSEDSIEKIIKNIINN